MQEIFKEYFRNSRSIWEVSNFGNVRRNGIDWPQNLVRNNEWRFGGGYATHRAVAELFIPNPENKPCVDHIDGNHMNNHVTNLRWVTYSENNLNPNWVERQRKSQKEKYSNGYVSPLKGKPKSEEARKHMSEAQTGRKHSLEQNKKHSLAMSGSGNPMYGKHWKVDPITKKRIYY